MPRLPARTIHLSTFASGSHLVRAENTAAVMRHAHRSVCITAMQSGRREFVVRSQRVCLGEGQLLVVSPGVVHSCRPWPDDSSCSAGQYVCLCVDPDRLRVGFSCLMNEPVLASAFLAVAEETETAVLAALERAMDAAEDSVQVLGKGDQSGNTVPLPQDVCRALQRMESAQQDGMHELSLAALAEGGQGDAVRLARRFKAHVGMPPIAWHMLRRIQTGAALLAQNHPIADVAVMTGFYDQSHFAHRFLQVMGMTPGQYLQGITAPKS